jgi:hypothetical protein
MGEPSFADKVMSFIGSVAWRVFLWSNRMTSEEYHTLYKLSVIRELPQTCAHGYNGICPKCDAYMTPPRKDA